MTRLRPFGDNPDRQYQGVDMDHLIGHLEELIREEEDRGDIAPRERGTPRERRLMRAYAALEALTDVEQGEWVKVISPLTHPPLSVLQCHP